MVDESVEVNSDIILNLNQEIPQQLQIEFQSSTGEPAILDQRMKGDYKQTYTHYSYDIDGEELDQAIAIEAALRPGDTITRNNQSTASHPIYEKLDKNNELTMRENKLSRNQFLNIQKQCSKKLSDWFYTI